ncbi:MAG TPA: 50S ribosomal protein L21e [Candidatus Woesearchaeota archaeon]|nr:50S ribosomal protein L21e [Candidatus Woesearchaeota archaeon]
MVARSHGLRVGTRKKLRKKVSTRGKISIRSVLSEYSVGDSVTIKVEPAYHKGMPYKRFFGKRGKVLDKRGKSYVVGIRTGKKTKEVICAPVHIKKA